MRLHTESLGQSSTGDTLHLAPIQGLTLKNSDHQVSQQMLNIPICQFLLLFPSLQGSQGHSFYAISSLWNLPDMGLITNSGLLATGYFHLSVKTVTHPSVTLPRSDLVLKTTLAHGSVVAEPKNSKSLWLSTAHLENALQAGMRGGVPLCLGTLSDTPHSLHQARGAHHQSRSWVSLSFLLAVWFFRQVLQSCPGFSQCFGIKLSFHLSLQARIWCMAWSFFLPLSHTGLFHRSSCRAPCQRSLGKTAGWKKDQKPHLPNAVTKQMLSSSVNFNLHKDFGRNIGCCSLILPYSFNITSKCLKSLQIQIKSVI